MEYVFEIEYQIGDKLIIDPYQNGERFETMIIGFEFEVTEKEVHKYIRVQWKGRAELVIVESDIVRECNDKE